MLHPTLQILSEFFLVVAILFISHTTLTIDKNTDGYLDGGTLVPFLYNYCVFPWMVSNVLVQGFVIFCRFILYDESPLQSVSPLGPLMTVVPVGSRGSIHVIIILPIMSARGVTPGTETVVEDIVVGVRQSGNPMTV